MTRYYIDTNIWIDYWEDRSDGIRPLGEFAFQFFKKVVQRGDMIYYSSFTLKELRTRLSYEAIEKHLFKQFRDSGILKYAEISDAQMDEAVKLASKRSVPVADALHSILARDKKAILISRDSHFNLLQDLAPVLKPEDVP